MIKYLGVWYGLSFILMYGSVLYEILQFDLLESFLLTIIVITSVPATDHIITYLLLSNFISIISAWFGIRWQSKTSFIFNHQIWCSIQSYTFTNIFFISYQITQHFKQQLQFKSHFKQQFKGKSTYFIHFKLVQVTQPTKSTKHHLNLAQSHSTTF